MVRITGLIIMSVVVTFTSGFGSGGVTSPAAIRALRQHTRPGEFVITDDEFAAASANRDIPGPLVDTSHIRINAGSLTTRLAERVARRDDIEAVLFATGRLDLLPNFRRWVEQHLPVMIRIAGGQTLYLDH
jgi:hypothetical protein